MLKGSTRLLKLTPQTVKRVYSNFLAVFGVTLNLVSLLFDLNSLAGVSRFIRTVNRNDNFIEMLRKMWQKCQNELRLEFVQQTVGWRGRNLFLNSA